METRARLCQRQVESLGLFTNLPSIVHCPAGKEFSVSDVAVGSYLLYLPLFFPNMPLTKYKHLWDYMKRIVSRPGVPSSYKEGMEAPMAAEQKSAGGAGGLLKKLGL